MIVAKSKVEAELIKDEMTEFLRKELNLELSYEKTHITNILDGFNFLGFNIRKYQHKSPYSKYHYTGTLLIKPQKEKVVKFLRKIQDDLNKNKQATVEFIIRELNPMLQGFAMYYRFVVSKKTLNFIQHQVWRKIWHWCKRRHPSKSNGWTNRKYYDQKETVKGIFWDKETNLKLVQIVKIPIVRFVKIKIGMKVHDENKETIEYWKKREYINALSQIYSVKIEKLYRQQKSRNCCQTTSLARCPAWAQN